MRSACLTSSCASSSTSSRKLIALVFRLSAEHKSTDRLRSQLRRYHAIVVQCRHRLCWSSAPQYGRVWGASRRTTRPGCLCHLTPVPLVSGGAPVRHNLATSLDKQFRAVSCPSMPPTLKHRASSERLRPSLSDNIVSQKSPMPAEPFSWNAVVVGAWNIAILSPDGVRRRLFDLPEGTPIELENRR